jgi:hypothetical protein
MRDRALTVRIEKIVDRNVYSLSLEVFIIVTVSELSRIYITRIFITLPMRVQLFRVDAIDAISIYYRICYFCVAFAIVSCNGTIFRPLSSNDNIIQSLIP